MYDRLYKQESEKTDRKKQSRKENKTGIPISMKIHFEEMSGYSFDDVRIHYSSSRPARFNALAYTQGNQVYIAPGQEKYLEHELGHVVQQKEGRVKPTFRIGNIPVNDDKALEQEANIRWHINQGFAPTERNTYRGQDVLQGQFITGKISPKPYFQQIGEILKNFLTSGLGILSQNGNFDNNSELCDDFINDFSNIYAQLEKIAEKDQDREIDLARLDILKNMIDHCNDKIYTHYHLYGDGSVLCDDNSQRTESSPNESAQPLFAAIDCRLTNINVKNVKLDNVLWIESFVSFQKDAGKKLLIELISDSRNDEIEYVALGAYPGTEGYYEGLGMKKIEQAYVLEGGLEVIDEEKAVLKMKEKAKELDMKEGATDHDYIERGLSYFLLYPVYYIEKEKL